MKNKEENVELFFKAVGEVNNTSRELYDKYIGDNLQIHKEGNVWTVNYQDKQAMALEEEGIYPFVPIIATVMLDNLSNIREDRKKAKSGENLQAQIRFRNAIMYFLTSEFLTKKYAERRKGKQITKKMVQEVWQFQGKVRTCLKTEAAQNIVDCLTIREKDDIGIFRLYNKPMGSEFVFYTDITEKESKTELFCIVAYIYEMKRRVKKQMARRKSKQFQEDAEYLLGEIQLFEEEQAFNLL